MVFTTTRHEKNIDVVALGEAMVEFNQTSPDQPQYLQGFGGDTSNATIAAARAGVRTAYLTRLGDDLFAQQLRQLWQTETDRGRSGGLGTQDGNGAQIAQEGYFYC
jgi:hypothetical protein